MIFSFENIVYPREIGPISWLLEIRLQTSGDSEHEKQGLCHSANG
jgi:hypothetical protein